MCFPGPVAHLVERLICTEEVAGSIPVRSTKANPRSIKTAGVLSFLDLPWPIAEIFFPLGFLFTFLKKDNILFFNTIDTDNPKHDC